MSANLVAFLYLVSGILFILALRGLSSPQTSRQGNMLGMVGMTIAVVTTLFQLSAPDSFLTWFLIIAGIAIGGGAGAYIARSIPMTAMPELVAASSTRTRYALSSSISPTVIEVTRTLPAAPASISVSVGISA